MTGYHRHFTSLTLFTLGSSLILSVSLYMAGCAHSFQYLPEISGPGAMFARHGVAYSIPSKDPEVRMKLVYVGMARIKEAQVKEKMMLIRMYLRRPHKEDAAPPSTSTKPPIRLLPSEQELILPLDPTPIRPAKVHASIAKKPWIELSPRGMQVVEFLFPMPKYDNRSKELQYFSVSWEIHYGQNNVEKQLTRFDRFDSAPEQDNGEAGAVDLDDPYAQALNLPMGTQWVPEPWFWW